MKKKLCGIYPKWNRRLVESKISRTQSNSKWRCLKFSKTIIPNHEKLHVALCSMIIALKSWSFLMFHYFNIKAFNVSTPRLLILFFTSLTKILENTLKYTIYSVISLLLSTELLENYHWVSHLSHFLRLI